MTAPIYQADLKEVTDLLERWITSSGKEGGIAWLREKKNEVTGGGATWRFFASFSGVPRFIGKADLNLTDSDLRQAHSVRAGWQPGRWSVDQAGRALLVLSYPHDDAPAYLKVLDQIFSTADVGESVALYQTLPLYPYPEHFRARAAEGIRSSMSSVFNAVALDNPYPAEYLDEAAWNQLVLKAVFVGSPLDRIDGLDRRANAELARMLVDYAHERRAASRPIAPDLWRPVGPFAGEAYHEELSQVLDSADPRDREAAALALASAGTDAAATLLAEKPNLAARIEAGDLTWDSWARNHRSEAT